MLFFDRLAQLEREHATFAIATVVARQSPVSSHLGDRALIFADGRMEGFVGGSCSRDIVRRHALETIAARQPVLLQIRPDGRPEAGRAQADTGVDRAERVVIPMSCSSEGAVDVYIEPRVPLRRMVIVGLTPVAEALAHLAASLEYDVVRVVVENELRDIGDGAAAAARGVRIIELKALAPLLAALGERTRCDTIAIVASQGHYDELALDVLLAAPIAFTGLLASRRRAATVLGVLAQQGIAPERLAMIHNPVGLDIGARSPGEVAVSILAEVIANDRSPNSSRAAASVAPGAAPVSTVALVAVDPVCGMDVETNGALNRHDHDGRTYVFCCAHCRSAFATDPARYLLSLGNA
jgi:xanthine dehydrogenase accessory factor